MYISSVGQTFAASTVSGGKAVPVQTADKPADVAGEVVPQARTINFRNVSQNELNQMVKAGKIELEDAFMLVPPNIVNEYGQEQAQNYKMDHLGALEKYAGFLIGMGEDASRVEQTIMRLKKVDGTEMPTKLDVTA